MFEGTIRPEGDIIVILGGIVSIVFGLGLGFKFCTELGSGLVVGSGKDGTILK